MIHILYHIYMVLLHNNLFIIIMHTFVDLLISMFLFNSILPHVRYGIRWVWILCTFRFLLLHLWNTNYPWSFHIYSSVQSTNLCWAWPSYCLFFTYIPLMLSDVEIYELNFHCIRCVLLAWLKNFATLLVPSSSSSYSWHLFDLIIHWFGFVYIHAWGICNYVLCGDMARQHAFVNTLDTS